MPRPLEMTPRIKQALVEGLCSIGQLSDQEKRELDRAVRKGWLSKGKGGPYPILKTMWARPGFDFAGDRKHEIDYMMYLHSLDVQRGVVSR